MVKRSILFFSLSFSFSLLSAQEIIPTLRFQGDSIKIGEPIECVLGVQYPKNWQVILPDSTFDFAPFEYVDKSFFPTTSDSLYAYDSVTYTLSSFEIDPVQSLQLPIFLLKAGDSIEISSNIDSVYLQEMIAVLPDSIKFRENVAFVPMDYAINYIYWSIGGAILVVILIATWLIFGKTILTKLKLRRLKKEYEKFSQELESGISQIRQQENSQPLIEGVLVSWKKYMERLEDRPFTKYTSREVVAAGYGQELKTILQNIDRAIYGNIGDDQMHKNFESLEDFTQERYQLKIKEVSNG